MTECYSLKQFDHQDVVYFGHLDVKYFDHLDVMFFDHQDVDQPFHGIHFVSAHAQGVNHPTISIYILIDISIDNLLKNKRF